MNSRHSDKLISHPLGTSVPVPLSMTCSKTLALHSSNKCGKSLSTAGDVVTSQNAAFIPNNVVMLVFLKKNNQLT